MIGWIKHRWMHLSSEETEGLMKYIELFYYDPRSFAMRRITSTTKSSEVKYSRRTPPEQRDRQEALTSISPDLAQLMMGDQYNSEHPYWQLMLPETGATFAQVLCKLIQDSGMESSKIYKKAQIDRRLYSKIISSLHLPPQFHYIPAKDTIISLAMALKLTLGETNALFHKAGYAFSDAFRRDLIIEYFFRNQIYNIDILNNTLYRLGEKTLGRQVL